MIYLLAVVAALIVAGGEVVQQRMAVQAPPQDNLSPKLLLWLVRRPRWLAGVACTFGGDVVFSAAVGAGSVILVEAVFTVRLVFGLVIAALWGLHRIPLRDVAAASAITAGLIAFLLVAQPQESTTHDVGDLRWGLGAGSVALLGLLLALAARRLSGPSRALPLGLGAGALFGLQASLMQHSVRMLGHGGVTALLSTWSTYAVVVAALSGMLLLQSAFNSAPLAASYPGAVSAQLICSIAIGIFVLGGSIRLGAVSLAVGIAALVTMLVGIVVLARSPLVTGHWHGHHRPHRRTDDGTAAAPEGARDDDRAGSRVPAASPASRRPQSEQ